MLQPSCQDNPHQLLDLCSKIKYKADESSSATYPPDTGKLKKVEHYVKILM